MGFYRDRVYPQLVTRLGDPPPIRCRRRQLLSEARGDVLEIGVGPGVNFVHYDPAKVKKLYALEPNPGMVRLAEEQRRHTTLAVEFLDLPGERIPLADASIDTVVTTFTLCTIPSVMDAIQGIASVLKPGGKLIFFEINLSPEPRVRRWQRWWEPVHRSMFEGLYLTRDIPSLLGQGGLQINHVETGYVARFPKSWSHCCWGTATPRPG
jgi:SAM-dependent methyltransferase